MLKHMPILEVII